MNNKRTVTSQQSSIGVRGWLCRQYNVRQQAQRQVNGKHTDNLSSLCIDGQAESDDRLSLCLIIFQRINPTRASCLYWFAIPYLFRVWNIPESLCLDNLRTDGLQLILIHMVDIRHEIPSSLLIIIRLEGDGTSCDIRIRLHHLTTVQEHTLRLVEMSQ